MVRINLDLHHVRPVLEGFQGTLMSKLRFPGIRQGF